MTRGTQGVGDRVVVRRTVAAIAATGMLVAMLVACAPDPAAPSPGELRVEVDATTQPSVEPAELDPEASAEVARLGTVGAFAMGTPMSIELDGEFPAAGATLTRAYAEPLPDGVAATFAYWDEEFETWRAVPSSMSADRRTLSAVVDHFSIWNDFLAGSAEAIGGIRDAAVGAGQATVEWVGDAVQTTGEALHWSLGNIFTTRVELPECDLPTPNWVIELPVGTGVDDPVRFCAGYDSQHPDLLVIKARSNRGYGFPAVLSVDPAWEYNSTDENTLGDTLDTIGSLDAAVGDVVAGLWAVGRYVGPGEEISFGIPAAALDGYDSEFRLEMPAPSLGQFLSSTVAQQLVAWGIGNAEANLAAALAVAACWSKVSAASDIGQASGAAVSCLASADEQVARLLGQVLLTRGMQENAAGRLAGKIVGQASLILAMLPAAISSLDYAAELNLPRSARALSITANPALAEAPETALPDGAAWLYDLSILDRSSTSGDEETAQIHRDGRLVEAPNSTNQWVGCNGAVSSTRYELGQGRTGVKLTLAVQAQAPAAMTVEFRIRLIDDSAGKALFDQTFTATQGMDPVEVQVAMLGARYFEIEARTSDACGSAAKGYASLVQSYAY